MACNTTKNDYLEREYQLLTRWIMGEVLRNVLLLTWMACAVNGNAQAAESQITIEEEMPADSSADTVVFGSARKPDGGQDEAIVEQNPDGGNPLGNPLVTEPEEPQTSVPALETTDPAAIQPAKPGIKPIEQSSQQGILKPWEEPLPQPSDKIENELYQSGNDIIDVQAYPIKDVSTVTEPNLQPRIITQ